MASRSALAARSSAGTVDNHIIAAMRFGLAAEVFQMIAEGLSNVRRHTHATRATVNLARRGDHLVVRIEDEGTPDSPPASFTPRSMRGAHTAR